MSVGDGHGSDYEQGWHNILVGELFQKVAVRVEWLLEGENEIIVIYLKIKSILIHN